MCNAAGRSFWTSPEHRPHLGILEELRQDLHTVLKKCRPDRDITSPELKAAWERGRKDLFYPYGKTYVQTLGEHY